MNKKFLAALLSAAIAMTAMTASVYGAADTESNFVRDSESPVSVQYEADATSEEGGPPNAVYVSETVEDAGTSSGDFLEDVVDELEPVDTDALLTAAQASLLEMQDGVAVIDMEELQVVNMDESGETERFAVFYGARIVTGWQQESGYWYYYKNGSKVTGWLELVESGTTYYYYLDPSYGGRMVTGLKTITSGGVSRKYYFTANGPMAHGWYNLKLSGDSAYYYYYFGVPGNASTGYMRISEWLQDTETSPVYWYYLDSKGHMLSYAWLSQNGERYYFAGDGHMISSTFYTIGSNYYYFTSSGAVETEWFIVGSSIYNADPSGVITRGTVQMSDYLKSTFDSSGRWVSDEMVAKADKPSNTSVTGYYTPANIRWDTLRIKDGHRQAVLSVTGATFNAKYYDSNVGMGPLVDVANYFTGSSQGRVSLTYTTLIDEADVAVSTSTDFLYPTVAAQTFCKNAQGQYLGGALSPGTTNEYLSFHNGTVVSATIVFNDNHSKVLTNEQVRAVTRHEMGHAIGLRHPFEPGHGETQPDVSSLMYPKYDKVGKSSSTFLNYDIVELKRTYPDYPYEEE